MAIRKSVLMMTNTGTQWNVIGEPVRADAYYGYTDGLHTVQFIYQNFVGGVGIQATLAIDPKPEDWFWIKMNPNGDNVNSPFLTFPLDRLNPTGANGGDVGSQAFTFQGNFVFVRAVLNRDYIQPPPPSNPVVPGYVYPPVFHNPKSCEQGSGTMQGPTSSIPWQTWQWGQIDKVLLSL